MPPAIPTTAESAAVSPVAIVRTMNSVSLTEKASRWHSFLQVTPAQRGWKGDKCPGPRRRSVVAPSRCQGFRKPKGFCNVCLKT